MNKKLRRQWYNALMDQERLWEEQYLADLGSWRRKAELLLPLVPQSPDAMGLVRKTLAKARKAFKAGE